MNIVSKKYTSKVKKKYDIEKLCNTAVPYF